MGKDFGPAPENSTMLHRSAFSETFLLPGGKRLTRTSPRQQHYQRVPGADTGSADGAWRDIDLNFVVRNGQILLDSAPYILEIAPAGIGFRYRSRDGGEGVQVALKQVGGRTDFNVPAPVLVGNQVRWPNVTPNVDFFIVANEGSIQVNKRLRSATAPRVFEYEYIEAGDPGFQINFQGRGRDNENEDDLGRTVRDRRRPIEVVLTKGAVDLEANPGKQTYRVREEWTGRAIKVRPDTQMPEWTTEVAYPVVVDPTFSQSISSTNNDCTETNATTNAVTATGPNGRVGVSGANTFAMGFRFTSLTVTGSAAITSATLNLTMGSAPVNSPGAYIAGVEAANPGVWDGTNRPSTVTETTAQSTVTDFTGASATDVKSVVEEILADTAFTNGNAMAFVMIPTTVVGYNLCYPQQVATFGSPTPAALSVVWTTGGGGGANPKGIFGLPMQGPLRRVVFP